jgi:tartrate-resistant acid phosphatase type 5
MHRFAAFLVVLTPSALVAQEDLGRVLPASRPLHVVALGDFGSGSRNQAAVAEAIGRKHKQQPFDLGITMGDNFYRCGVRSVDDPMWQSRWENLYSPLDIRFYAALGNHDYGHPPVICPGGRGSVDAQIERSKISASWRMPARYYTFAAGPVRFIAIDTEGWSADQLAWIKKTLADSAREPGVRWRILYGHHPMFTSGVHLNQRRIRVLVQELLPVMKASRTDIYIAGHDHDMEHLRSDGIDFLISGTGGAELRRVRHRQPQSLFTASRFGFIDLLIDERRIEARFLGTDLKQLENPPATRSLAEPRL